MNSNPQIEPCRACGETGPHQLVSHLSDGFSLWSCPACLTVGAQSCSAAAELSTLYDDLFSGADYIQHEREFQDALRGTIRPGRSRVRLLDRLESECPGRELVEIGGGTGVFGLAAVRRGWSYRDYDVSTVAVDKATRLGLQAFTYPANELPPLEPLSADAVVMWEVLEHLPRAYEMLQLIRRSLRPGGYLLLSTPNFGLDHYRRAVLEGRGTGPPVHLSFFTRTSLATTLKSLGFVARVNEQRFYSPDPNPRSVLRSIATALGLRPGKTLVALATPAT